ncbi:MAG: BamA/OMP85 family outer membrane protein [Gemmatimonadota bacterium]
MVAALATSLAGAQETGGGRRLVSAVRAEGVTAVDRDELLNGLATRGSSCKSFLYAPFCLLSRSPAFVARRFLDPTELRRDVLRIRLFYWRRGYRDATVQTRLEESRGGVRVVFDIEEGPPTIVTTLEVMHDSVLSGEFITATLKLRAGEPLDLSAVDSSLVELRAALWERGYAEASVTLDTTRISNVNNGGPVTLTVISGLLTRVADIEIEGNRSISLGTVRRILRFREGSTYRRSDVLESQRNLYLSGLFSEVEIEALPRPDSGERLVRISVVEAPRRHLEFTGGFTNADFLQGQTQFTRFNFFGGARRLTARATVSNILAAQLSNAGPFIDVTQGAPPDERDRFFRPTWAASLDFNQPWLLTPRNQLGASVFTHRRSVPGVVTDRGAGATVAITNDFRPTINTTLGYTWEASRVDASRVYFCVTSGICSVSLIDVISARHPLAPVSLVTQGDDSDDAFAPTRGMRWRFDLEHASAGTGSDYQYNRAAASASRYMRVGRSSVLAVRARAGWVNAIPGTNRTLGVTGDSADPVIHPRKLFFAGGSQSVRGYGENQLGPRVLTIDPAELTDPDLPSPCTESQLVDGSCDPNTEGVGHDKFQPRPLGANSVAEVSVELRFPIGAFRSLRGAVFVDGAVLGTPRFTGLLGRTGTFTPGFGVRFDTRAGPVRLDLGIKPRVIENLPVITEVRDEDGDPQLVSLSRVRRFDQAVASGGTLGRIMSRLTLHLAIGPAF